MHRKTWALSVAAAAGLIAHPASGQLTGLTSFTLLEDPPNANLTAAFGSGGEAVLTANGAVPDGVDIGLASVDGPTVSGSTSGFFFAPDTDFSIAIDYAVAFDGSVGAGGIGFGIGVDADGADSAGIGLAFNNGGVLGTASAGRVGDEDTPVGPITILTGPASGRFFVGYDADAGAATVGLSATPGAGVPDGSLPAAPPITEIADAFEGQPLLVSFFLRSEQLTVPLTSTVLPPLSAGTVTATFSNLEVLAGTPIAVPEPAAGLVLLAFGGVALGRRLRTH
ncbi:MAG: hypothetical protein AAFX76_06425 [Planctomycetota bacterium]